jgi:hypothetical protein
MADVAPRQLKPPCLGHSLILHSGNHMDVIDCPWVFCPLRFEFYFQRADFILTQEVLAIP